MNKSITITSSYNLFNFNSSFSLFNKVEIFSLTNKNIVIKLDKNSTIVKINQREGSWVRLTDKNDVWKDFITDEILIIDSIEGVLIQSLGYIKELDIQNITNILFAYIQNKNIKKIDQDFLFEYRKNMGKKIKEDFNFLINNKVNLSYSKNAYEKKRKATLKRYLEFSAIKRKLVKSWEEIKLHLINKQKYEKNI